MINFVNSLLIWTTILRMIGAQQQQYQPVDIAVVFDRHLIRGTEFDPNDDSIQIDGDRDAVLLWWCMQGNGFTEIAYAFRNWRDRDRGSDWLHDTRMAVFLFHKDDASNPTVVVKFSDTRTTDFYAMTQRFFHPNYTIVRDPEGNYVNREYEKGRPPYSVASFNTYARQMYDAIQRPDTGNRPHVPDVVIWLLQTRRDDDAAEMIIRNRARLVNPCDNYVNMFVVARYHDLNECYITMLGRSMDQEYFFKKQRGVEGRENVHRTVRLALSTIDQCSSPTKRSMPAIDPCAGSQPTDQCFFDDKLECKACRGGQRTACDRSQCEQRCNADDQVDFTNCDADCDATGVKTTWPKKAAEGDSSYVNCPKKEKVPCAGIKCECSPVPEYSGQCYFRSSDVCMINAVMKMPTGLSANAQRQCQNSNLLGDHPQPCDKGPGECQRLCDNDRDRMVVECDAQCDLQGEIKSRPKNRPFCGSKVERTCTGPPCTCQWEKVINETIDCYFHDDGMCRKVIQHDWDPNMEERFRKQCPDDTSYECEKKKCDDKCNADEPYKDACVGECFMMGMRRVRSMKAVQNVQYYHNCPETTEPCFNNCTETTTRGTRPSTYTWTVRSRRTTEPTTPSTTMESTSIFTTAAKQLGARTESPGVLETWHIILIVLLILIIIVITVIAVVIVTKSRKRRRRARDHGYGGEARGRAPDRRGGRRDQSGRGDKKKSPRDAGRDRGQGHGRQIGRDRDDRSEGPSGGRTKPPSGQSFQLSKTGRPTPPRARHGSPRLPKSPRAHSGGRRR